MRRIFVCIAVLSIVLSQRVAQGQDESAFEHLKPLESAIGEWVAEFKIPSGHPEFGEEGESAVFSGTWRWMLKKNFMVINMKRQIGEKTSLSKEIISWDAKSGQLVHWIYNDRGHVGRGEWSVDGDKWALRWSTTHPDKTVRKGTSHMVKIDEDTLSWRGTDMTLDGQPLADFPTVTYRRKKQ